ncbi:helix-turn-helix transcriptional regulator [Timonella senegalensis]|uniref:helix-turn-helix transcriptional regulator n=1 Tax=Timonella senegalensis TaxID=1465825 RepID=UPI0028A8D7C4|nr:helix-turn-helix transcriptional regulator [Timonella senegalensis]
MTTTSAWIRLGQRVIERRVELGMETTTAFADATGLSTRILGDLENGRKDSYRASTLLRIEKVLGWTAGSIEAVLAGGEATPRVEQVQAPASRLQAESAREAAIQVELSRETTEELVQGIQYRVGELRRRVESADQLLADLNSNGGQDEYDLVADDAPDFEDEDMMREMEP